MAHVRNVFFELFTALDENATECFQALEHMNNLKQEHGFFFRHLHYGAKSEHTEYVINNFIENDAYTGSEELRYPFMTYRKLHDENDQFNEEMVFVIGLDSIVNTDWVELEEFRGSTEEN